MKEIQLTQGKAALVDDEDYEWLNQFKWHTHKGGNKRSKTLYARRQSLRDSNGKSVIVSLHSSIVNVPFGFEIDHIDGDGLNNQKSNLRIVTHRENGQNHHRKTSSKYPGVHWKKSKKQWEAKILLNGTRRYLGLFDIEEEAATAYKVACEVLK